MNSFRFVAQGIDAEVARQIAVYECGGEVVQETYDFDAGSGTLTARRSKEEADDYRYFPEPDLVPVEPPAELVERLRAEVPESPARRIRRIEAELDLDRAVVLVTGGLDRLWQATVAAGADRLAGGEPDRQPARRRRRGARSIRRELAKLVEARDRIPRAALDEALANVAEPGFTAADYLAQEAVSDTAELEPIVARILDANPGQVAAYKGGKEGLLGFFVGQVMKETGGKANARAVSELVREKLQ